MSDFLSADAASNSGSSPSTNNEPQTADISAMAGDRTNPDPGKRASGEAPLRLVETAFLASTASLIWLVNYYFPLGPLLRVFFPIPIALVYLRWGNRASLDGSFGIGFAAVGTHGPDAEHFIRDAFWNYGSCAGRTVEA